MELPSADVDKSPVLPEERRPSTLGITKTLLPAPVASLISFATATSSLSLRIGGFIGHLAIDLSRIGALSGVELGRAALESVLFRAGQDVLDSSIGGRGQATAEGILDSALSTLHSSLAHTSFLISAGFRLGSSSLSASLGLSNALCTAIDAVFGDTETSKAIATIVILVQREFKDPATGVEKLSLGDILSGTLSFALLQRWSWQRTEDMLKEEGAIEPVWDIVVVDMEDTMTDYDQQFVTDESAAPAIEATETESDNMLDDSASVVTDVSSSVGPSNGNVTRPEQAFRQQLSQQLKPGTSVRVNARSTTKNVVTVEIDGDSSSEVEPPTGYKLVAVQKRGHGPNTVRSYVFHNTKKRLRRGSFEVETPPQDLLSSLTGFANPRIASSIGLHTATLVYEQNPAIYEEAVDTDAPMPPVKANTKRPRLPVNSQSASEYGMPSLLTSSGRDAIAPSASAPKAGKRESLKQTLKRGTSYKNLVDFWFHGPTTRSRNPNPDIQSITQDHRMLRPGISPHVSRDALSGRGPMIRRYSDFKPSLDVEQRPGSRESFRARSVHRRGGSSIYTLDTGNVSDTSLVLHADGMKASRDHIAQSLHTTGRLAGQYPMAPFAANAARFARFSVASYGSSFLRFMGAATAQEAREVSEHRVGHHFEHHSFSTYARLPSSTVLVSSFVDPDGGANRHGQTETGMPLIHYISLDHESKAVVLTCRGTLGFEDVLTDMTCDYEELHWRGKQYEVHKGMLASARRLLSIHGSRLIATIKAALEEFDDYGLVLCGHSLGGGVTALLGVLMSQPNPAYPISGDAPAFVTASPSSTRAVIDSSGPYPHPSDALALTLPGDRPIHVYAYGPAATMCPALSRATRGLITTIINNSDIVPYLSLGNLSDIQAVSLAFKIDTSNAKGEVRRRVWEKLRKSFTTNSGLGAAEDFFAKGWTQGQQLHDDDDIWPWSALKSLRASMLAEKLVPPGECFIVERRAVLQRLAFTDAPGNEGTKNDDARKDTKAFKPASHIRVTHVRDVAKRFTEIRFESGMILDHLPARYEKILEALQMGVA